MDKRKVIRMYKEVINSKSNKRLPSEFYNNSLDEIISIRNMILKYVYKDLLKFNKAQAIANTSIEFAKKYKFLNIVRKTCKGNFDAEEVVNIVYGNSPTINWWESDKNSIKYKNDLECYTNIFKEYIKKHNISEKFVIRKIGSEYFNKKIIRLRKGIKPMDVILNVYPDYQPWQLACRPVDYYFNINNLKKYIRGMINEYAIEKDITREKAACTIRMSYFNKYIGIYNALNKTGLNIYLFIIKEYKISPLDMHRTISFYRNRECLEVLFQAFANKYKKPISKVTFCDLNKELPHSAITSIGGTNYIKEKYGYIKPRDYSISGDKILNTIVIADENHMVTIDKRQFLNTKFKDWKHQYIKLDSLDKEQFEEIINTFINKFNNIVLLQPSIIISSKIASIIGFNNSFNNHLCKLYIVDKEENNKEGIFNSNKEHWKLLSV